MAEPTSVLKEREPVDVPQKKFTAADYERALQALQRLRESREGLPEVDTVTIIREMRDSGGRGWAEGEDDEH